MRKSIDALVHLIERGEDPASVIESHLLPESYAVPRFSVGNRVLVQGLSSPLSGKVIALKEDGDLCTIETEKGSMDVPAQHLVMQESWQEQKSPRDDYDDYEIQRIGVNRNVVIYKPTGEPIHNTRWLPDDAVKNQIDYDIRARRERLW